MTSLLDPMQTVSNSFVMVLKPMGVDITCTDPADSEQHRRDVQSNPETAPLCISPPLHCTHKSLETEIYYVTSKGIPQYSFVMCHYTMQYEQFIINA